MEASVRRHLHVITAGLFAILVLGIGDVPALFLYGEPSIWAAQKSLKGIAFNRLESLHPLHQAYFEE
jgi:hypothetical protein